MPFSRDNEPTKKKKTIASHSVHYRASTSSHWVHYTRENESTYLTPSNIIWGKLKNISLQSNSRLGVHNNQWDYGAKKISWSKRSNWHLSTKANALINPSIHPSATNEWPPNLRRESWPPRSKRWWMHKAPTITTIFVCAPIFPSLFPIFHPSISSSPPRWSRVCVHCRKSPRNVCKCRLEGSTIVNIHTV
jgi:hypothetical protein